MISIINRRSWYFFMLLSFYLIAGAILRATLFQLFGPGILHGPLLFMRVLAAGFHCDLAVGLFVFAPLALWLQFSPTRIFKSGLHQIVLVTGVSIYLVAQLFLFIVEFEFFDEFTSRFNTVAVDYLIYPQEVFVNIWESYPVVKILSSVIVIGLFISFFMHKRYRRFENALPSRGARVKWGGVYLCVAIAAGLFKVFQSGISANDRVIHEIVQNGNASFVRAAVTRDLDYPSFYKTLPADEAYARTRVLLSSPGATFDSVPNSIERIIPAKESPQQLNVVVLLIESFGSEFWGSLGRKEQTLTPEMDALSKEGLLFTNVFACGNRTVRGMEGVLASFPPLPSDSVVKRAKSDRISTIGRTLLDFGYDTLFAYGGRGLFDGMRSFTTRNGFERFIEQKDFPNPTFTTIWGVCDEDLYHRGIEELRKLHDSKKPFLVTFLSVSNHKPYTYPKGRIAEDPEQHSRSFAVKYTDWALGEFFRMAKKEAFYKDTVFVVVADHGARVYGSQSIPIPSYRIPILMVGPNIKPGKVDTLAGSLDVTPTLLGLIGRPYRSVFFGQDILKKDPTKAWAVMHHNRDIGLFRNNRFVVLGLNKTVEHFRMENNQLERLSTLTAEDNELEKDAIALFQVADDLYSNQRYFVEKSASLAN